MKKKFLFLLTMLFLVPQFVFAKNYIDADSKLTLNGTYNGSTLHMGETIDSDANIKGIGAMAAQDINLNGNVDYAFLAGEKININGIVNNDLYAAAQTVNLKGTVKRDANIAASNVTISGIIERSRRIDATKVTLENVVIKNNVKINASEIVVKGNVKINGKLKYNENAEVDEKLSSYNTETFKTEEHVTTTSDIIRDIITSMIGMLIIGFVISFTAPNVYEKLRNKNISFEESTKTICIGFITLFAVPIALIILMITIIALPLGLIGLALYLIAIYLSGLFAGYVIAHNLLTKGFKKEENEYLSIVIGVFIAKIISYIPFVGGLLSILIFLYGLGLVVNLIPKKIKN